MDAELQIAEVARRSGFTATTLRYYEEIGLVTPTSRTPAGYRLYDERTLERLAFIDRAKHLGCSLDEIRELVDAWDGGPCAPVQDRLRDLIESKIAAAQHQAVDLLALTSELRRTRADLDRHTPDGPCDDDCGCVTSSHQAARGEAVTVDSGPSDTTPIACTLEGAAMPGRLTDWQALLASVQERAAVPDGMRLTFGPGVTVTDVARLAAAERECCQFFSFAITMDGRGFGLEVTAPAEAQPILDALFGIPA
jgi:DNA-binding transcriptional MerR regulator